MSLGFLPGAANGLIQIVGLKLAPIVLSLNASFMYLGFSLGAAVGGFTLIHATVTGPWLGRCCVRAGRRDTLSQDSRSYEGAGNARR